MKKSRDRERRLAMNAAVQAGRMLLRRFYGRAQKVTWQNLNDLKTAADKASGEVIRPLLMEHFPEIGILSEEEGDYLHGAPRTWVVDEIDGTICFTHAVKLGAKIHRMSDHWAVMIALCEGCMPVLGVIYAPARDELFVAEYGKGAFLNGRRLRPKNPETDLHRITIGVDPGKADKDVPDQRLRLVRILDRLWADDGVNCVWTGGCASIPIALTATGVMDAYLSVGLNPEDMAAGVVLNREVGNKVTTLAGQDWVLGDESIFIANPVLHKKLLELLR